MLSELPSGALGALAVIMFVFGMMAGYSLKRYVPRGVPSSNDQETISQVKRALYKAGLDSKEVNLAVNRLENAGFIFITRY